MFSSSVLHPAVANLRGLHSFLLNTLTQTLRNQLCPTGIVGAITPLGPNALKHEICKQLRLPSVCISTLTLALTYLAKNAAVGGDT